MLQRQTEGGQVQERVESPTIPTFPTDPSRCSCGGAIRSGTLETACDSCGIVYDDSPLVVLLPFGEEGVAPGNEPIPKDGPATTVGYDRSAIGRRLRSAEQRTTSKASRIERSRARRWKAGKIVAERLGLSKNVQVEVADIMRDTRVPGRSFDAIAGAVAIVVARKHSMLLGIREAGSVLGIPWPDVGRALSSLKRNNRTARVPPVAASTLLVRILNRLPEPLPADLRRWCFSAVRILEDRPHRVSPQNLACVPLLALSRSRRDLHFLTQAAIARAAGLTELTVRNGGRVLDDFGYLLSPVPPGPPEVATPPESEATPCDV